MRSTDETTAAGSGENMDGEYHFSGEQVYSDAHYIPADQSTVPPRYYTPDNSGKAEKNTAKPQAKKHGAGKTFGILLLCVLSIVLGAAGGAAITEYRYASRLHALEAGITDTQKELASVTEEVETVKTDLATAEEGITSVEAAFSTLQEDGKAGLDTTGAAAQARAVFSASDIYSMACRQVVGITTEVTYTNFFGQTSSSAVTGTGFVIREDGYILTNYHVIEYAYLYNYETTVILHDGTRYPAEVVGVEEDNDLAVLKIDNTGLTPAVLGDSDQIAVGDTVYAVGNPLGELNFTMTIGHVSALDRLITTDETDVAINMFQIDASVNTGNSGGPVYNESGEVVGIVTAKYSETGVEGIGFAIPANDTVSIAEELISKGYVTGKAYLGVQLDSRYSSAYSRYYGTPLGAYVSDVGQGTAAEEAGIKPRDIITEIGGIKIESYGEVSSVLKQFSAGESAEVTVYRAGDTLTLRVVFDELVPTNTRGSTW